METLELNDGQLLNYESTLDANQESISVVITDDFNIVRLTEDYYNWLYDNDRLSLSALYIIKDQQLNAHGKTVISVHDPEDLSDAVNKHYIDSLVTPIINTNISTEHVGNNEVANGIYINDKESQRAAFIQLEAYNINNSYRPGDTLYKMIVNRGLNENNIETNEAVLGIGLHALKGAGDEITSYQGFAVCPTPQEDSNTNEIATTEWITNRISSLINVLSTNI